MFSKLRTFIVRVASILAGLAFCVMIVAVLTQVVGRTIGSSPVWTEELTRFALLYMTAFGVGLSLQSGDLVNVDIICDNLPKPLTKILQIIATAITLGFCLLLLKPAYMFFQIGAIQKSPALGLRMDFMHVTVVILLALLALFCAVRLVRIFLGLPAYQNTKNGEPE